MDIIEIRIIMDAITVYCTRKEQGPEVEAKLNSDLAKGIEFWTDKCSTNNTNAEKVFSKHFWKVVNKYFTDKCITVLIDRYINKMTYQAIGDMYGFSRTCAQQKVTQILEKLPKYKIWRELLFDEIYLVKERKSVSKDTIYGTTISSRAKTSLIRFLEEKSEELREEITPTADNVAKYLINLNMLKLCGRSTRNEIIKYFNSIGYKNLVKSWKKQIADEAKAKIAEKEAAKAARASAKTTTKEVVK